MSTCCCYIFFSEFFFVRIGTKYKDTLTEQKNFKKKLKILAMKKITGYTQRVYEKVILKEFTLPALQVLSLNLAPTISLYLYCEGGNSSIQLF